MRTYLETIVDYAVFRIREWDPPHRTALSYGRNDNDYHINMLGQSCAASTVEHCASIRVASASLSLRNAVIKDISSMISVAARRGSRAELIEKLTSLRDADPPSALSMVEAHHSARALLREHEIDLPRSWSDDLRINSRLDAKLGRYHAALAAPQK